MSEFAENIIPAITSNAVRNFETGATRNVDTNKFDYEAFLSPLALKRFGEFMHKNRHQKDGTLRDGDNWQKGIPFPAYAKSLLRHVIDFWLHHRQLPDETAEDLETTLCAIIFNASGYLHELLKEKRAK